MIKPKRSLKIPIVAICIILILVHAFMVFLPHRHGSCDIDCIVCALKETFGEIFAFLTFCSFVNYIIQQCNVISDSHENALPIADITPVGLRVKLLD